MERIAFLGHVTRPESARIFIDDEMSKGRTLDEIRQDEAAFQKKVLSLKEWAEGTAPADQVIFWDRGMPDSITYFERCGIDTKPAIEASSRRRYRKVFLLDRLPDYQGDYCRTEDDKAARWIHESLEKSYEQLGYAVVRVPVMPISERAEFLLARLG